MENYIHLERYFKTENEERALQGSSQNPTDLQPVSITGTYPCSKCISCVSYFSGLQPA